MTRSALGVVRLAAVSVLMCAACSSNVVESDGQTNTTTLVGPAPTTSNEADVSRGVVGSGCADYVRQVSDTARDPVAVALSNSAELTTLAGALSGKLNPDVKLTDTLNKGQYTVFAPTDDAFGKLPPATLDKFRNDGTQLSAVLKYHVVSGELDPQAVIGEQTTMQGQTLKVTSAGDGLRVNDAGVVCGGIQTANAIVYLVDTVLIPSLGGQSTTPASGSPEGSISPDESNSSGATDETATETAAPTSKATPTATPTS